MVLTLHHIYKAWHCQYQEGLVKWSYSSKLVDYCCCAQQGLSAVWSGCTRSPYFRAQLRELDWPCNRPSGGLYFYLTRISPCSDIPCRLCSKAVLLPRRATINANYLYALWPYKSSAALLGTVPNHKHYSLFELSCTRLHWVWPIKMMQPDALRRRKACLLWTIMLSASYQPMNATPALSFCQELMSLAQNTADNRSHWTAWFIQQSCCNGVVSEYV